MINTIYKEGITEILFSIPKLSKIGENMRLMVLSPSKVLHFSPNCSQRKEENVTIPISFYLFSVYIGEFEISCKGPYHFAIPSQIPMCLQRKRINSQKKKKEKNKVQTLITCKREKRLPAQPMSLHPMYFSLGLCL